MRAAGAGLMDAQFPPISALLPHRGPALLIDSVLAERPDGIRVAAHITPAHPYFVPGRGVPAWVGIELMAQAIAARAGLDAQRTHTTPGSGMLLGTRRYHTQLAYFPEGARLEISAQREFSDESGVVACTCEISCDGKSLATATIIVMKTAAEHAP